MLLSLRRSRGVYFPLKPFSFGLSYASTLLKQRPIVRPLPSSIFFRTLCSSDDAHNITLKSDEDNNQHDKNNLKISLPVPCKLLTTRTALPGELITMEIDDLPPDTKEIALFHLNLKTNKISPVGVLASIRSRDGRSCTLRGEYRISWLENDDQLKNKMIHPLRLKDQLDNLSDSDVKKLIHYEYWDKSAPVGEGVDKMLTQFFGQLRSFGPYYPISVHQSVVETLNVQARIQKYFLILENAHNYEEGLEPLEEPDSTTKFKERLSKLKRLPEEVKVLIEEEMSKLLSLNPATSDFHISYNYLDWLTVLPWGEYSEDKFSIKSTEDILNEDHYGLEELKERILEFIAVGHLAKTIQGKILCLVGPPGTGKTSIAKSIAKALDREFFRFSVGGLTDVSEIKGHRRTYVGAIPGKLIQALKHLKSSNPLILIDEIDKLGRGHYGDPSAALLEVLDPEQNKEFMDHYLDVPFDLSKILFVTTANTLSTIPHPLLNRMEVLKLSGYTSEEKIKIANKHIIPTLLKTMGLDDKVKFTDEVIEHLIRYYCREAGVRNLKKTLEKILRKIARKVVKGEIVGVEDLTIKNLTEYAGDPVYPSKTVYDSTPPGVSLGLGSTRIGAIALYVEAIADKTQSAHKIRCTGQLGDVMKESTNIAYTYARNFLATLDPSNRYFERTSIHMHFPEGGVPKDGSTAGTTIVTSLLSLALGQSVKANTAIIGEITLMGKVLAVSNMKDLIIAAKHAEIKHLILPEGNKPEFEGLPDHLRKGLATYFVGNYEQVFKIAFPAAKVTKPMSLSA